VVELSTLFAVLTGLQAGSDLFTKIKGVFQRRFDWDQFWEDADVCFKAALTTSELTELQQLPLRELSPLKKALGDLHDSGSSAECSEAVKVVLERDWRINDKGRLGELAETYCDCAKRALLVQSFKDQPGFLLVVNVLFDLGKIIRNVANRRAMLPVPNYGDNVERFLDFYLREERVFVGREDELTALREKALGREQGFAFVAAPAGKGKSALLSRLWLGLHLSPHLDVKTIFMPISTRFGTANKKAFYERLAHELSVVYGIEKPEAGSEVEALRHYSQSLLNQPPDEQLKLVLIIDGLDEATDWNPVREPPFPLHLGAQVRLVLSARTTPDHPDAARWSGALGLPPDRGLFLNLGNLSKADVRRALAEARLPEIAPEDAEVVANELYRLTEEGDPLLLDLYLDALNPQKGGIPKLTADKLINIAPGYAGYFESWQEALESRLRHQGLGDLRDLAVTVFTILSYAKGPLSRVDLGAVVRFWLTSKRQNDEYFAVRFEKILEHGNRLLAGNGEALSLAHPRLGEFFQQKYGLYEPDFERTYANWGLNAWREAKTITDNRTTRPLPRYLLEHLSSHLADLGMLNELAELVADPTWFRESREYDSSLRLLAQDLNRLLDLTMEQRRRPDIWTTDIFYLNRLHGNANNLPIAIFSYFGKVRRTAEAMGWIELTTDEEKRSGALMALTNALPPREIHTFADALRKQARSLTHINSARVLALITKRLKAVDLKRAMEAADEALEVAGQVLETARKVDDSWRKVWALTNIAIALAEVDTEKAREAAAEALEAAREIENSWRKVWALAGLAKALAGVELEKALAVAGQALEVARSIEDGSERAIALAEVALALTEVDAEKALEVAREIENSWRKVWALAGIAKKTGTEKSWEVAGQALEVARRIEDGPHRAMVLANIAIALAEIDPDRVREVTSEALDMTSKTQEPRKRDMDTVIKDARYRGEALAGIAIALAEVDTEKAREAAAEALEVARGIEDSWYRTMALKVITESLAEADPMKTLEAADEALEVARGIEDASERDKALAEMTKAFAGVDAEKALEVARGIEDASERAKALAEVTKAFAGFDAEKARKMAGEAREATHGIRDDNVRTKALAKVAIALAEVEPEKALAAARGIEDSGEMAKALAEVTKALAGVNAEKASEAAGEALEAAREIKHGCYRAVVLAGISEALAKVDQEGARNVAVETRDAINEARAARKRDVMGSMILKDGWSRAEALAGISEALAEADPEMAREVAGQALEVAQEIEHGWSKVWALASITKALARTDAEKAQETFMEAARTARERNFTWGWLEKAYPAFAALDPGNITYGYDRLKNIQKLLNSL